MTALEKRFWAKVNKAGPIPEHAPELGPCWIWTAGKGGGGYGRFHYQGRWAMAHVVSLILAGTPLPDGMLADHRCHRHECIRPSHIRPATRKQNAEHRKGPNTGSASGILGVYPHKTGKWKVLVGHNGKLIYGGLHPDKNAAAIVAQDLRNSLHTHNDIDRITS